MSASVEKWQIFLKRAIQRNRLGHALLLVSEDETARKTAAHYFAKLLLCKKHTIKDVIAPCEKCSDCTEINLSRHLNIEWLGDSAEGIRIDQIREVREQLRLRAFSDRPRLIVLCNANSLTTAAANALLKSLEEPSANQYFLLLASSRFSLLKTIASRCQTLVVSPSKFIKPNDEHHEISGVAKGLISRIFQGDTTLRSAIIDEIMKNTEDKSALLLHIQKQLHVELCKSQGVPPKLRRNELLKCIEATEFSRSLLERNTNIQLTLENWLLNLWPYPQA